MSTTEQTAALGNTPTHFAYHVARTKNDKGIWTKIGVAWEHQDKGGFNILLECIPIDGRISLRAASEKTK